ncbi:hypothetical protein MVES_001224 [Malassezia vespertilionis]|uniref:Uncharacterized protein n=1 Tax=Malassezia vespertilionis TaxID=2020962 RepID=A0A2N1JEW2_9BASI|nr:hypothetical protein MVES_001224 [Malassezia vespertilionis]
MDAPKEKRVRTDATETKERRAHESAALYTPFRALGYVTNGVPFLLQTRFGGKDAQTPDVTIITCLGDAWAMWNAERMTLLFVGPLLPDAVTSMAISTSPDSVLVAAGTRVHRYVRGKEVAVYSTEDEEGGTSGTPLSSLAVFGDMVVALAADGRAAFVWSLATIELQHTLCFPTGFTAASLVHPATYLNKIVIGSIEGALQLWNVRTGTLVYAFSPASLRGAECAAGIVALEQSPAVDIVAAAYADGLVLLYDVGLAECLFSVRVEGGLGPGCVAFRTDGEAHTLALGTRAGSLVLFDLAAVEDGGNGAAPRLLHSIQHAHDGPIGGIAFVPGQPLLITSGTDNALKEWFFESPTLPPRLLKSRSGHALPPHLVRYYGEDGRNILSASRDRSLRCLSVVRDSRSFELSQGSVESKANKLALDATSFKRAPIASLSYSTTRSRDWDDVLTAHANDRFAHTWTVRDKHMNKAPLSAAPSKKHAAVATAACVSACGNFGLLGTSHGDVHIYNMQSHIFRRSFLTGTTDAVVDIVTDAVNQVCLVGTQDGTLHYFDFHTAQRLATQHLAAGCTGLCLHRDSNLVAAMTDDLALLVIDIDTRRIARRFTGFRGRILDACFSPDGRWIVSCSTDGVVRTFDIATAQLIDAFRPPSMATSVTFSPTGDFLATAHVDSVGVHLWVNRALFAPVALRALGMGDVSQEREAAMPTLQGTALDTDEMDMVLDVGEPAFQRTYTSPPQLHDGARPLITLSTMPRARWITLLHLDTIKRRNKPQEALKKPEKVPFFLEAALPDTHSPSYAAPASPHNHADLLFASNMERRLRAAVDAGDVAPLFTYLHTLPAPQLDVEIRSLESTAQQTLFLQALALRLHAKQDYEAVQAMLAVFLDAHGEALQANGVDPDSASPDQGAALALALRQGAGLCAHWNTVWEH